MTTQPISTEPEDTFDEEDDECCQRCSTTYHPDDVAILDEGPVCKWCCNAADLETVRDELELEDGETLELFLADWQASKA